MFIEGILHLLLALFGRALRHFDANFCLDLFWIDIIFAGRDIAEDAQEVWLTAGNCLALGLQSLLRFFKPANGVRYGRRRMHLADVGDFLVLETNGSQDRQDVLWPG